MLFDDLKGKLVIHHSVTVHSNLSVIENRVQHVEDYVKRTDKDEDSEHQVPGFILFVVMKEVADDRIHMKRESNFICAVVEVVIIMETQQLVSRVNQHVYFFGHFSSVTVILPFHIVVEVVSDVVD